MTRSHRSLACPAVPRPRSPFGRHLPRQSPRTMFLDPRAPRAPSREHFAPPLLGFEPSSSRTSPPLGSPPSSRASRCVRVHRCRCPPPERLGAPGQRRCGGSATSTSGRVDRPPSLVTRPERAAWSALGRDLDGAVSCPFDDPLENLRRGHPHPQRSKARSAPPSTSPNRVHSQRAAGEPDLSPSAPTCQGRSPVPPTWFLTTATAFSARRLAGLLHPAADPGVHPVSPLPHRRLSPTPLGSPRFPGTLPPLEVLPRSAAVAQSPAPSAPSPLSPATASFRTLGRCRLILLCDRPSGASASRLCSANRSVPPRRCCQRRGACPSWAF